jgi:hypothetical protein
MTKKVKKVESFKGFVLANGVQPTYVVFRKGKPRLAVVGTYDDARNIARQLIRREVRAGKAGRRGLWDNISRNPTSLMDYGFEIKRAE